MNCILHLGDWRTFEWPTPCVLVTDPPYGIHHRLTSSHSWRGGKLPGFEHHDTEPGDLVANDRDTSERDAALEAIGWTAAAIFGPRRVDVVPPWGCPRDLLVFDKGPGVGAGDLSLPWKPCWETIAIYGLGWTGHRGSGVLRGSKMAFRAGTSPNGRTHPCEKPLRILRELVGKAPADLPIVDPFMGSGTTGVAALEFGRSFYGAELVPEHFGVARVRLQDVEAGPGPQRTLFETQEAEES